MARAADERIDAGLIAAIDLGSNSFHLLLAAPGDGSFHVVETLKEKVQLLAGSHNGEIHDAAFERARDCLRRFRQRLAAVSPERTFVRGTYALRQAVNADKFVAELCDWFGPQVEVISGYQEASLIYQAVSRGLAFDANKMIVDIGGGSTELARGNGVDVTVCASVSVGCVALSDKYFNSDHRQTESFRLAKRDVVLAMTSLQGSHPELWSERGVVVGTSGTIESVQTVLKANGWIWDAITKDGLARLERAIVEEHWFVEGGLPGLSPDRVDIFAAGAAILCGVFEALEIDEMAYGDVSLQHGIMFDALDQRAPGERIAVDLAQNSIDNLQAIFEIDVAQARRVRHQCESLYAKTTGVQQATDSWASDEESRQILSWSAQLHEIGRRINSAHYHRHGAYVVKHSHLPGLSKVTQETLSLLIRGHRRSLPRLAFQAFEPAVAARLTRLLSLLRIAVILERSHSDLDSPVYQVACDSGSIHLEFSFGWLVNHPLSTSELAVEATQLRAIGLKLTYCDAASSQEEGVSPLRLSLN